MTSQEFKLTKPIDKWRVRFVTFWISDERAVVDSEGDILKMSRADARALYRHYMAAGFSAA